MGKIVISKIFNKDYLFLFNDEHEIEMIKNIDESIVDNIYIGKIVEINEGLHAAFVSFDKDKKAFLSLSEFNNDNYPKCGDEFPIQIKTDALKTKLPQAGLDLCLPGEYVVCHLNPFGLKVSKKLDKNVQTELIKTVNEKNIDNFNEFGWVLRTNSELLLETDFQPLFDEINQKIELAAKIKNQACHLSLYSKIFSAPSKLISQINDLDINSFDTIITDIPEVYNELNQSNLLIQKTLKLYEDEYVSLKNLHSLETYLNRAVDKTVYLDCGGYLIIEPTEALTVIDVNSGKAESRRRDSKSFIFKVNRQAALEVAKQIKIRNISGIIIVDFINMEDVNDNDNLLKILKEEVGKDKVTTRVIDMTPLGLVEITRKKVDSPLKF